MVGTKSQAKLETHILPFSFCLCILEMEMELVVGGFSTLGEIGACHLIIHRVNLARKVSFFYSMEKECRQNGINIFRLLLF